MKLSKRLETIAGMVPRLPEGGCVADVGTDHGFVPIWLVEHGTCSRALAMDVRRGPLERAREHIRQHRLEEAVETRLSDGLEKLKPGEADVVVIAGMGGELMLRILQDGDHVRDSVKCWILSPQSELEEFRKGLERLGLAVCRETMLVDDGKYYTVMAAEPGSMHYEEDFRYRYGDCLIRERSPVLREFLGKERRQLEEIAAGLESRGGEAARTRLSDIRQRLKEIEDVYDTMR